METISEIIEALQKIKEEHGDVEFTIYDDYKGQGYSIKDIEYDDNFVWLVI